MDKVRSGGVESAQIGPQDLWTATADKKSSLPTARTTCGW
jgi:hypothetical protein